MNSTITVILVVLAVLFGVLLVQKAIKMAFLLLLLVVILGYLAYEHVPGARDYLHEHKPKIQKALDKPQKALKP